VGGRWEGLVFDEVKKSLGEELMMAGVPFSGTSCSSQVCSVTPSLDGQSGLHSIRAPHSSI
jgi:hypothetical protein